ncbi:MAG: sugar ABC transporter substrate-binding protein [Lachnospiraceae bacterium]|nr:sugar ABC transporter substrate-binding protein [Lachnospiraceae bacterium]
MKKLVALLLVLAMAMACLTACGSSEEPATTETKPAETTTATTETKPAETTTAATTTTTTTESDTAAPEEQAAPVEVTNFTMFITMPGNEINSDNEIADMIAQKWGVKVKETWLTGQTASEATGTILASGQYPDFIDSDEMSMLVDADALIALDDYIDQYPEFRDTWFTPEEWEKFRQPDGHIYWINPFGNTLGKSKATGHNDEAFWIQCRVLEWAGYPQIKTMDQYFDVIERYIAANPTMPDGTPNLAYTILCEDWRYFCLENAGQFLAGYPNDGSVIVNKSTMTIEDYNVSADTKKYFQKLNEEYNKGFVDPESFTQTYDEYIAKLSTGRVLGMVDQFWDFAYTVNDVFKVTGLEDLGCNYVPLGLTTEEGMVNRWHTYDDTVNQASGIAITTSCADPDKAFKFIVDCAMDQELHDLRYWGVKGVDYEVDADGLFYRTDAQRANWADTSYQAKHRCQYTYFPQWHGTSRDGKNANKPEEQPSEFFLSLSKPLVDTFKAYGAGNYPDMIGSIQETNGPWFPMYSYSNNFTTETPGGLAWALMGETKHEWLPKVVMAPDFEATWADYMNVYNACNPQDFLAEMQAILDTFK